MHQWLRLESLFVLAVVIGVTKVLHELGHALMCKRFGGECHQIGPMLLVFTPALYCDTSDSWMLPNRWQRAAVGVAGIATEVLLASLATFVWVSTGPGLSHFIAMNVMLVCGVSTVFFNANPLLRYDGYYVLSDLCDVPNLGERSRKLLAGDFARICLGVDEPSDEVFSRRSRFWLTVYAVTATAYRWGLTLLILWFVSQLLRPYRLGIDWQTAVPFCSWWPRLHVAPPSISFFAPPGSSEIDSNETCRCEYVYSCRHGLWSDVPATFRGIG